MIPPFESLLVEYTEFSEFVRDFATILRSLYPESHCFLFQKEDLLEELGLIYSTRAEDEIYGDLNFAQFKNYLLKTLGMRSGVYQNPVGEFLGFFPKSLLCCPMSWGDGKQGLWVLADCHQTSRFSLEDLHSLESAISLVQPVLEKLKLRQIVSVYQAEQKLTETLNNLVDQQKSMDGFLKELVVLIEEVTKAQIIVLLFYDENTRLYTLSAGNSDGCEFYTKQETFFKSLAEQSRTQGTFARSYSGKNFKGEKYGLDRLETALILPLKFYEKNLGAFIILNKAGQENFHNLDVRLMNLIIRTSKTVIFREREKNSIVNVFKKFVSDKIVRELLDNPMQNFLREERKLISILFIDLNNFTDYSESVDPSALIVQLNEFLSEMTELVFAYGGTLDKYIGDEIMALFGSPISTDNHPQRAVECAIAMQNKMQELRMRWRAKRRMPLTASIGICTGNAIVGTIGCDKYMDYTAIGDSVNTASRITEAADHDSTWISLYTWEPMQDVILYDGPKDLVVKGKQGKVRVYAVHGLKSLPLIREEFLQGNLEKKLRILRSVSWFDAFFESEVPVIALQDKNREVRMEALQTIRILNREKDIDPLMDAVEAEKDSEVRERILQTISDISGEAIVSLLKDYLCELEPGTKSEVIKAIGYQGGEENKKLLLPLLNDTDHRVRANVAHALYLFGDSSIVEILVRMLQTGEDEMKISAVEVLGKIGTTQVVRPLIGLLNQPVSAAMHFAVARAFSRIDKPRTLKFCRYVVREGILCDWEEYFALRCTQKPSAFKIKKLLSSKNIFVVHALLRYLEEKDCTDYTAKLLLILETKVAILQRQVITCLRKVYSEEIADCYFSKLSEFEDDVKRDVLMDLSFRRDSRVIPVLHKLLQEGNPDMQMSCVMALKQFATKESFEILARLWKESDNANLKATVIRALGFLNFEGVVEVLKEALHSSIGRIRANAIDSLIQIQCKESIPWLRPLLSDENNRVRANAALALWKFGDDDIYTQLDQMMGSDDKWMRLSAIWTLAEIASPRSREIIEHHLSDSDYDVKLRAILSLNKLGQNIMNLLENMIDCQDTPKVYSKA